MKKLSSKNYLIAALLFTNSLAFGYILVDKTHIAERVMALFKSKDAHLTPEPIKTKTPKSRTASVAGVNYFKENDKLQKCYENLLLEDPAVDEGSVLFHWTISTDGVVNDLEMIRSDFLNEGFETCLQEQIQDQIMTPPNAPEGTIIAHTFKFKRKSLSEANFASAE